MASFTYPFTVKQYQENIDDIYNSELYHKLPEDFKVVVNNNPHLLEYMLMLPVSQTGIPEFHTELTKSMSDIKEPNIIYPVSNG
ncbi:MAG: secretion system protein E, partial [Dehalococcoidales bacterium]|nr:secretion system protein E [Dehalococcoidales bacterium]